MLAVQDDWRNRRAALLERIIPHLPVEFLPEALETVLAVQEDRRRAELLEGIIPHLPVEFLPKALEAARAFDDVERRAEVLGAIVPHLPAEFLPKALEAARALDHVERRAEVLGKIARSFPEIWSEALETVLAVQEDRRRAALLERIIPYLPAEFLPKVLEAARAFDDVQHRAEVLGKIARGLPEIWSEALEAVLAVQDDWRNRRAALLERIIPHLPAEFLPKVLEATRAFDDVQHRAEVLGAIVPHLPAEFLPKVLEAVRAFDDVQHRAEVLGKIARSFPEIWSEALETVLAVQDDWLGRRDELLKKLLLQGVWGGRRAELLEGIIPHLPAEFLPTALEARLDAWSKVLDAARAIQDETLQARAFGYIARHLPRNLMPELLTAALGLHGQKRASALGKISFFLPPSLLPTAWKLIPGLMSRQLDSMSPIVTQIKTYGLILPPRLVRNLLVIIFYEISGDVAITDGPYEPGWPFINTWEWYSALEVSVFTEKKLRKGIWCVLSVWLHRESDKGTVQECAGQLGRDKLAGEATGMVAQMGRLITLSLKPRFLHTTDNWVNPKSQVEKTILWHGSPANADFIVKCPESYKEDRLLETITMRVDGLQIGEVTVELRFEKANEVLARLTLIRSAFASYSRVDAPEVVARLQAIEKLLPDLDIFWDIESLRSGEMWEERLMEEVVTKDIFYLFWSINAARSKWVGREWRLAYNRRGLEYIDPFPLDSTNPPKELEPLQFADRWVRHIEYENVLRCEHRGKSAAPGGRNVQHPWR